MSEENKNGNNTDNGEQQSKGLLNVIEKIGNKLPEPFFIFIYLAGIVMILSMIFHWFGATVEHPGTGEMLEIKSLLSFEGLEFILSSMISNFTGFAPLGLVLVMMFGIGLADKVGLLETAIKSSILKAPKSLITYAVVFVGILGNIASDAAFVLIPPLAAMVFYTIGRHPLAGLAAGFAGAGSGFTANILVTGTDALLSGITTEAAKSIDESFIVTPVDNYFFMAASVFIMTIVGGLITDKLVEPRLGEYKGNVEKEVNEVTALELRGLRNAVIAALIYIAVVLLLIFLPGSSLTNEDGGLIPSPLLSNIVPIILLLFITVGSAYGITTKKIKSQNDVVTYMAESIKGMAGYIVLIFAAAQFIAYFNWSNLGTWIAVNSADALISINLTGLPIVIAFSVLMTLLNLIIFSGSAQWALMAPIFVPMFMLLDYNPAFIQAAYRIADSSTSVITPLNPYILLVLAVMRNYQKNTGLGTLISMMLPYALSFFGIWVVMLIIFAFLGIPFGPGVGVNM